MNNQIAFELLKKVKNTLNSINVPYFLVCGTLLGFVRDGDFISHDLDIDLGIFIEDWSPKIIEEFVKCGFQFYRQLGTRENGLEYTFRKNSINVDLFFYYKSGDKIFSCAYWKENKPENQIISQHNIFDIGQLTVRGESFSVPKNYEAYLENVYGKNWRVPDKTWHWAASPKNIVSAPFNTKVKKTICLSMIVKNEFHTIKDCLESVKSLIDYYVIFDTGSTDNTKEIIKNTLKEIPGEIIDAEWKNFGYNRTQTMQYSRKKANYSLVIDADMIINGQVDKYFLIADTYKIKILGNPTYYLPLLFNNKIEWKSIGATHEYWKCNERFIEEVLPTLSILHKCNGDYRKNKFENDVKLLKQGIKEEPNNTRYMFYLAQSYFDVGEFDLATIWYEKRISSGGWWEEIYYSLYRLLCCKIKQNKPFEEIVEATFRAYTYHQHSAEALYELLRYCRIMGYYFFGYFAGKLVETIKTPQRTLFVHSPAYNYAVCDELSICAYWCGRYKESYDLCNQLLNNPLCPANEKTRIKQNLNFAKEKLNKK